MAVASLTMYDLVIRGGTIADGTGGPLKSGDVAIEGGIVQQVGGTAAAGKREIDGKGQLVTPGFVDIHTHYDAQATWDPMVTPSSWHGVTTVVMGSCGVGFAPVKPERRDWLIGLMEGVEDIPGAAMTEGMKWGWETFAEYMDALEVLPRAIDIATQVPHGAVRGYVMEERGAKNEPSRPDDIEKMAKIVYDGIKAGALGFSTSRTLIHKGADGEYVPGTFAGEDELFGIGRAMAAAGPCVFQMTSNHVDMPKEYVWMRRLAEETGLTISFNLLQTDAAPDLWKTMSQHLDEASASGLDIYGQVAARPQGVLMSWAGTAHPFLFVPAYMGLHHLPVQERLQELRKPEVRAKIIADKPLQIGEFENFIVESFHKMYQLGAEPNYEPLPSESASAIAQARGVTPQEVAYDWLMEDDGKGFIYFPIFNYSNENLDHLHTLLQHPRSAIGLGDGGAHCGVICDASIPTFMLSHWTRDRTRGAKLSVEAAVHMQTQKTAHVFGLGDRGVLAPGMKGDANVIDLDALTLHAPYMAYDLPTDARRLVQKASGYRATIVSGQVVLQDGEGTGPRPGKLIRGAR